MLRQLFPVLPAYFFEKKYMLIEKKEGAAAAPLFIRFIQEGRHYVGNSCGIDIRGTDEYTGGF